MALLTLHEVDPLRNDAEMLQGDHPEALLVTLGDVAEVPQHGLERRVGEFAPDTVL